MYHSVFMEILQSCSNLSDDSLLLVFAVSFVEIFEQRAGILPFHLNARAESLHVFHGEVFHQMLMVEIFATVKLFLQSPLILWLALIGFLE